MPQFTQENDIDYVTNSIQFFEKADSAMGRLFWFIQQIKIVFNGKKIILYIIMTEVKL